jgi:ribosomal-protein-alanine N-acetyltransferase
MTVRIWRGAASDAATLARLHAPVFSDAWPEEAFRSLIEREGVIVLLASRLAAGAAEGFILIRSVAGECEVLTFCVADEARRAGVGGMLLDAACAAAREAGAKEMFLEVGERNAAALALYRRRSFADVGRRAAYYHHGDDAADALVLRKALKPQ